MIKIKKHGIILEPTSLPFENQSVLNPGVYQDGNKVHVIYRAIDSNFISCLGYARLDGPTQVAERWDKPFLYPSKKVESKGIEDPRIVKIEDTFYMTYVVHDGKNAITAFSSGTDLLNMDRGFVISPKIPYREAGNIFRFSKLKDDYYFFEAFYKEYNGSNILIWHKDVILFPEKINGKYALLHRILPDIQYLEFDDFGELKDKYFWINYLFNLSKNVVLEGEHGFESRHLGGGAPPLKTEHGWLMIYHGVQEFNSKRIYRTSVALLDLNNPVKVIARLPYPLFSPTDGFEIVGTVNNVVFSSGTSVFGDDLYIYYGAADRCIAAVSVSMNDLINELLKNKIKSDQTK